MFFGLFKSFSQKKREAAERLEKTKLPPIGTIIEITTDYTGSTYKKGDWTTIVGYEYGFALVPIKDEPENTEPKIALCREWYEVI